ncbi:MAG: bifunctional demethylmenaquinone methyltransferase/2-methoxy-6-polyprenyl-1,4-benzoquinol methylase UbiE [Bacteroidales bacterium]|nr:bifunctional demethylmenaquinone methyltransferase/2-methoxy-6-polyprenyl-1,4-benzoquinol methylase UbiE [Bacteroidales bacterium]
MEEKTTTPIKPYYQEGQSKATEVEQMFNAIAPKYDLLNHLLSMNIDKGWRKKAISSLKDLSPLSHILDVATGTGDLAIMAHKMLGVPVTGTDLTEGMIEIGRQKVAKEGYQDKIELAKADSEALPFADNQFDAVTVAFGVRNYAHLDKGLSEMARVIRHGGRMVILEFSKPRHFPMKQLYMFYFRHILPVIGRCVSKDRRAYDYLPESVLAFPDGTDFEEHLITAGVAPVKRISLTFGIATIYIAEKQ